MPQVKEGLFYQEGDLLGKVQGTNVSSVPGPPATHGAAIPPDSGRYGAGVPIHTALQQDSVGYLPSFIVPMCFLGRKCPLVLSSFNKHLMSYGGQLLC